MGEGRHLSPAHHLDKLLTRAQNPFDVSDGVLERLRGAVMFQVELHSWRHRNTPSPALRCSSFRHIFLLADGSSLVLWELCHDSAGAGDAGNTVLYEVYDSAEALHRSERRVHSWMGREESGAPDHPGTPGALGRTDPGGEPADGGEGAHGGPGRLAGMGGPGDAGSPSGMTGADPYGFEGEDGDGDGPPEHGLGARDLEHGWEAHAQEGFGIEDFGPADSGLAGHERHEGPDGPGDTSGGHGRTGSADPFASPDPLDPFTGIGHGPAHVSYDFLDWAGPAHERHEYTEGNSPEHARRLLRRAENSDRPGEETLRLLATALGHHILHVPKPQAPDAECHVWCSVYEHAFLLADGTKVSLYELEHNLTGSGHLVCEVYLDETVADQAAQRLARDRGIDL
ncbi:DUF6227 family protein [Streptomyces axinellae]|uniref:Uncharacterized protein n=1 Tax=Streptomyces axinellae TaxID=552788 RepID=A0ABN3QTH7_9ACTN